MVEYMAGFMAAKFPSFQKTQMRWQGRHTVVLENALFQVAVTDNQWSAAWLLLEHPNACDVGGNRNLMRRHYQTYLEAIKTALIEEYGEAIGYGGAWTSGKVYKKEAEV
jgi:hypothetical protein